jgi:hypothetical protein
MSVMVVALAVPGYVAYQDPAQLREGVDAITPRLDAPSAVQATASPQQTPQGGRPLGGGTPQASSGESILPAGDSAAPQRDAALVLPTPQAADATRESPSQPAHNAIEPQSPPSKAAGNSKASQAGKNVRQTRSGATGSKQGSSSRKAAKPKASDARTRAKSSNARPAQSTEKTAGSEIMP